MKKLLVAIIAIATLAANAIDIRDVTFSADEIPATNPRIERRGDVVTHIEVFGAFETRPDGSAKTRVAESAIDMDAITAQLWVREAKAALGAATPRTFSKIRLKIAIAKLGKLQALETWLASIEVAPGYSALAAWNDAQVIQDDFEGFKTIYAAAKLALDVTDEQAEALLAQCLAD